uniref:VWFA domain-containing protein n=1 Tax=Acrobeloides nanus TaxID=290746 RepID=A0A914EF62_9BILA
MGAGDTIVITDGTMTKTIDSTLCAANDKGNTQIQLFNGSYSNYLNVTVTENSAALFILSFQQGEPLTRQQTTTPAGTTASYNGTGPNPQGARMELAFVVDSSFGPGPTFFSTTTIPIIKNLASYFRIGTDINTDLTRLSLVRLATQSSYGGSLAPAWTIDQPTFDKLLSTIYLPGVNNSIFSTTLNTFIQDAFAVGGETPTRNKTQKVLLIFVNTDVNPNDNSSNLINLANQLMYYDVHAIVVNMGSDPLPLLLKTPGSLVGTLQGSNKLRYYQYNIVDGVTGTVDNLLSQVLLNGNFLCATGIADNNVTVDGTAPPITATITLPYSNKQPTAQIIQQQAYCNNMNTEYTYTPKLATTSITVTVVQQEITAGVDYLDVYNGIDLVASFSGLEITNAQICFSNASYIKVVLETKNSWVLGGVKVTILEAATPCPVLTWPPTTFYRRKK